MLQIFSLNKLKHFIILGFSLGLLIYLVKKIESHFIYFNFSIELFSASLIIIFTSVGFWFANKTIKTKIETVTIEKEVIVFSNPVFVPNTTLISNLQISKRELDVLKLMANGMSNNEIATSLFISISTVKVHIQNLFFKLEAKRRTQAIEKAKQLKIIE